ncbi:hypothetical protein HZS_2720 [Henneguya salminicola]|nr:hypothetical protein HZS_2720 [Henneguya salminicola]
MCTADLATTVMMRTNSLTDTSEKLYLFDLLNARCVQSAYFYRKLVIYRYKQEKNFMNEISSFFCDILKLQNEIKTEKMKLLKISRLSYMSKALSVLANQLSDQKNLFSSTYKIIKEINELVSRSFSYIFTDSSFKNIDDIYNYLEKIAKICSNIQENLNINSEKIGSTSKILQSCSSNYVSLVDKFCSLQIIFNSIKGLILKHKVAYIHTALNNENETFEIE